jgi:hypothetical protein
MNTLDSKQFALGAMFLTTLMIAALVGLTSQFGLQGLAFGVDLCVLLWTAASISGLNTFRPFSDLRPSITDFGVLIVICLILHGLAMPGGQSGPHPRRTPAVGVPAAAPAVAPTAEHPWLVLRTRDDTKPMY